MEKKQYFKEVAGLVKEKRETSEYTPAEKIAFEEGRRNALRNVLIDSGNKWTYSAMLKKVESMTKFLEREKKGGKLATEDIDTELWEKHLAYSSVELHSFVMLNIHDFRMRLKKAREINALNAKLIQEHISLNID